MKRYDDTRRVAYNPVTQQWYVMIGVTIDSGPYDNENEAIAAMNSARVR